MMKEKEMKKAVINVLPLLLEGKTYEQNTSAARYVSIIRLYSDFRSSSQRSAFISDLILILSKDKMPFLKPEFLLKLMHRYQSYPQIFHELQFFLRQTNRRRIDVKFIEMIIFHSGINPCSQKEQRSRLILLGWLHDHLQTSLFPTSNYSFINAILELNIPAEDQKTLKKQLKNDPSSPYFLLFDRIKRALQSSLSGLQRNEIITRHFSPVDHDFHHSTIHQKLFSRLDEILPEHYLLELNRSDLKKIRKVVNIRPELIDHLQDLRSEGVSGYLVFHALFTEYTIPPVLRHKYFDDYMTETERSWFFHVLKGENLMTAPDLPFRLTKRMAHTFQIMDDIYNLTVTQSLVFSALLTLTNDIPYSHTVTRVSWASNQSDFWINTMAMLHRNGLREENAREVFDYILQKVFRERRTLDLKRKKISNLLLDVEDWHRALRIRREERYTRTQKLADAGIPEKKIEIGNFEYRIFQLIHSNDLFEEGNDLRHCVYSYKYQCRIGRSFIFSLRQKITDDNEKRLLTIEVVNNEIVQAKGQRNRQPNELEKEIIQLWADEQMIRFIA